MKKTFNYIFVAFLSLLILSCSIQQPLPSIETDLKNIIENASEGDTIYLGKKIYRTNGFHIRKKIVLIGNNTIIQGTKNVNIGLSFVKNAHIENISFDGVWVAFKTRSFKKGLIKECKFFNQTFSNISIIGGASNIDVINNEFKGKAKGKKGTSTYPCLQITTGAKNISFRYNSCINVEAGVTADGINTLIDNIIVENNDFEQLTYYALKTDVGNHFLFKDNRVKNAGYGVFYEALDENQKYSQRSGNNVVVENNTFEKVRSCFYIAGMNPFTKVIFESNIAKDCNYGVCRSTGKLIIKGNSFSGGALYHFFDSTVQGDIEIISNKITNAGLKLMKNKRVKKNDWHNSIIQGCIVLNSGIMSSESTVKIKRNEFVDWIGRAIHVARVANTYPNIIIVENEFRNDKKIEKLITVGAAKNILFDRNTIMFEVDEIIEVPDSKSLTGKLKITNTLGVNKK